MVRQNTGIRLQLTRRWLLGIWMAGITAVSDFSNVRATDRRSQSTSMIGEKRLHRDMQAALAGRLLARPKRPTGTAKLGLQPLRLDAERDGFLYVPAGETVRTHYTLLLVENAQAN